ncbi:MAG: DUF397 domain-containing protein [Pseudonocardia sp.]|nr:DUF397 domain-containing protein [Pseudonocardia sp.]MBO0876178.1 DUF397 domain-containing protein [Pseudonocardia sp.]
MDLAGVAWRKGSQAADDSYVETAGLPDGRIAVRRSGRSDNVVLLFTKAEWRAWLKGCKAGEFDDLIDA